MTGEENHLILSFLFSHLFFVDILSLFLKSDNFSFNSQFLVWDPFMGTGTTGVVAGNFGCKYFGTEVDPDCGNPAYNRVHTVYKEKKLISKQTGFFILFLLFYFLTFFAEEFDPDAHMALPLNPSAPVVSIPLPPDFFNSSLPDWQSFSD